jgi:hypothetical protein
MDRALNTGTAATPYISHGSRRGIAAASGVMTGQNAQEIRDQILAYLRMQGGDSGSWYVGITCEIERRLFGDHRVPPANHWYICRQAASSEAAHEAERALLALGFDGRPAREGDHGVFVYAYLKTASTEP